MFDIKKFLTENRIPLHEDAVNTLLNLQQELGKFNSTYKAGYKVDPSYPQYDDKAAKEIDRQAKIIIDALKKIEKALA